MPWYVNLGICRHLLKKPALVKAKIRNRIHILHLCFFVHQTGNQRYGRSWFWSIVSWNQQICLLASTGLRNFILFNYALNDIIMATIISFIDLCLSRGPPCIGTSQIERSTTGLWWYLQKSTALVKIWQYLLELIYVMLSSSWLKQLNV